MSTVKIYKASAGSGKTYRLTGEYIDLLFENPWNYKHILAVTFTNKASAEMKNRIVEELYKLSQGINSGYSVPLKKKHDLSDDHLREKASYCLSLLLHDYSRFSVETIDRFFQKIIIAFIREIGLQTGFTLELDSETVLKDVTDKMLFEIESDEVLKKWLINLAEDKVEKGQNWNFRNDIITLGKELFREDFKISKHAILQKASDKVFIKKYIAELQSIITTFENKLTAFGKKANEHIKQSGLDNQDFSQGQRGIGGFFDKLAMGDIPETMNTYVKKCVEDDEAWFTKNSEKKETIIGAVSGGLKDILLQINNIYAEDLIPYNTAKSIVNYLPLLGIITDISNRIREYTEENNSFLIADAADFLYQITGHNESPFIYEKSGNFYKYFMIDEFQDTSRLQWHNFRPLILNSLSENNDALLVGDVKQSIYRWRNSDWKLLAGEIKNDFIPYGTREVPLNVNWRSSKEIITFNNIIFKNIVDCLQEYYNQQVEGSIAKDKYSDRIREVYNHHEQEHPDKEIRTEGCVELEFTDKENFRQQARQSMVKKLIGLRDLGYNLKDIAILVRNRKDGKEIAEHLIAENSRPNQYQFDFISNDSLFISNNKVIQILIYALKYIHDNEDTLTLFSLGVSWYEYKHRHTIFGMRQYETEDINKQFLLGFLPPGFEETLSVLKGFSVYDITEYLVNFFAFNMDETVYPYLQAFKDLVHEFTLNKTAHLSGFLEWWETTGINKTIAINEEQDAIKIITIHKAKGLQFKAVLIPFCNWELDHQGVLTNILWCGAIAPPFNQVEKLPVRYSSKLANTLLNEAYYEEKLQTYVDNINLLYVAFTRAEEYLYVCCETNEKNGKLKNVGDAMFMAIQNPGDTSGLNLNTGENNIFTYGKLTGKEKTPGPGHIKQPKRYTSLPLFDKLKFTKHAGEYFSNEKGYLQKIEYGKLMHKVFQLIFTVNDVPKVMDNFIAEGKIDGDEAVEIKEKIKHALSGKEQQNWFSGKYKVLNEAEIALGDKNVYRPDRVMKNNDDIIVVDYKFGAKEEKKHQNQVRGYVDTIRAMYHGKNIEGYLWYVDQGITKKIV